MRGWKLWGMLEGIVGLLLLLIDEDDEGMCVGTDDDDMAIFSL